MKKLLFLFATLGLASASWGQGSVLFASDFDLPTSTTAAGFTSTVVEPDAEPSVDVGDYTLTFTNLSADLRRDRGDGFVGATDLYRDFIKDGDDAFTLSISGLDPNTAFDFTFFAWESGFSGPVTGTQSYTVSTGIGLGGTASYGTTAPATNDDYATTFRAISDATGVVGWDIALTAGTNNQVILNGIQVETVPEPATYAAILGALALGLSIYRRRR